MNPNLLDTLVRVVIRVLSAIPPRWFHRNKRARKPAHKAAHKPARKK